MSRVNVKSNASFKPTNNYKQRLRQLSYPLLRLLYKLVCITGVHNPKKLVFMSVPDMSDNGWHLYRYLSRTLTGYSFIWICRDVELAERKIASSSVKASTQVLSRKTLRAGLHFITARYVFHTHGTYYFVSKSNGPTIVNLWHGMPIKKIAYLEGRSSCEVSYGDYTISTSDYYSRIMSQAFRIDPSKVIMSGLPRNDSLLSSCRGAKSIMAKLNIPTDNDIAVWLPTYRTSILGDIRSDSITDSFLIEWSDSDLQHVNNQASSSNCTVIIKLHPMDKLNGATRLPNYSNIKIIKQQDWGDTGVDLYELLSISSVLISDVSSVIIDYLVTNKPICLIGSALENYTRGVVSGVNKEFLTSAFFIAYNANDLATFIKSKKGKTLDKAVRYKLHECPGDIGCANKTIASRLGLL